MKLSTKGLLTLGMFVSLALLVSSCGGGGSTYGVSGTSGTTTTVEVVACPATGTEDISIVSSTAGFSPASVTVQVNRIVKWTNNDSMQHTVTGTTVPANGTFDRTVGSGASVCLKFTSAGTFNYRCTLHSTMPTGVVIVE